MRRNVLITLLTISISLGMSSSLLAQEIYGPEELVQSGTEDIVVPGYSVPSFVYWDGDALMDLVIGEGSSAFPGKVRIYLNNGIEENPQFSSYFFAQSSGTDLVVTGSG